MIDDQYKRVIEDYLGQAISKLSLLAETYPSHIYRVEAGKIYVCKVTKECSLARQYENHRRVFNHWSQQQTSFNFKIPEPYLLGPRGQFVLMEYIEGLNLLNILNQHHPKAMRLFKQAGRGLNQYHKLVDTFKEATDLMECESIQAVLARPGGHEIRKRLERIDTDKCGVIFKDFTPANIVVTKQDELYFLDIQDVFYRGPLYYDLARFIDTTKVFGLVTKPLVPLGKYIRIRQAITAFMSGYDQAIDLELLHEIQSIHRQEHVHIKMTATRVRGMILKLMYKFL